MKSHNLLRIERWKRFGTTVLKDFLLHTLRFESQGNMFVVKGPASKELLTRNWKSGETSNVAQGNQELDLVEHS